MQQPWISYQNVHKSFGTQKVCHDFNLDIFKNETFVILGPSGVGKTVTIKLLIGLLRPDSGDVWFDGKNLAQYETDEDFLPIRKRIAMVFQGAALFDSMNVFDNVAYPLREHDQKSSGEVKDLVQERLEWVGLKESGYKMPSELSGGMKKRVGLARAIIRNPEVILYDEPTAGLDPINTARIVELILNLSKRLHATSLVVTHDIQAACHMADRAAFLYEGRVRALGKASELMESEDPHVKGFMTGNARLWDNDLR